MSRISHRLGSIAESATMAISNRAKIMRTEGRDVISFGAGEPDFPTPDHIVEAAVEACRDPKNHKYTANAGLPELREALVTFTARDSGVEVDPSQILVTNGGKQAVFQSFAALLNPGDEAIVPAPYWVTYPEAIKLAGGVPVPVSTDASSGFKVTVDQLEEATNDRTKLVVFVSPSNPTGAVYTADETAAIARWAGERGIWVVTDEIYQHLVYGDARFTSIAGASELEDRWVIISGVAKSFAMTGWRVGWMVGPRDVIKAAANHQSHLSSNVANVSQRAALAAVTGPMDEVWRMPRGVRPQAADDDTTAQRDPRCVLRRAARSVLLLPRLHRSSRSIRSHVDDRSGCRHPRERRGRLGARRGVRRPRIRPPQLCPLRRATHRGPPPPPHLLHLTLALQPWVAVKTYRAESPRLV